MSKVFFDVGITLDGFIAGQNGGAKNPLGDDGLKIHNWMFKQKAFLSHIKLEGGDENNPDNELIESLFNRIGANIMGNKMFVEGEANWPEEAPFHCPVYVLTHQKREPWERYGGASVIQQYLNAGLIDEFTLHTVPMIMGKGVRLFENIVKEKCPVEISEVVDSPMVTHLFYKVIKK